MQGDDDWLGHATAATLHRTSEARIAAGEEKHQPPVKRRVEENDSNVPGQKGFIADQDMERRRVNNWRA